MSFETILIAKRGDSSCEAWAAAKGRVGPADASRRHIAWHAKHAVIEPRKHHV